MRGVNIPTYNQSGGGNAPWINPPVGPPNNPKECGGGVNSPRNDRKKDAKTAMTIGAQPREQIHVYENSDDPPGYAHQPDGTGKTEQRKPKPNFKNGERHHCQPSP